MDKTIEPLKINRRDQLADLFTKRFPAVKHRRLRAKSGVLRTNQVHTRTHEHGVNKTAVAVVSAVGHAILPTILFKGHKGKLEWKDRMTPDTLVEMTLKVQWQMKSL